jgi:lipopolysaccharide/colanic/teichoic acid biosynthesis glycosyltransferase
MTQDHLQGVRRPKPWFASRAVLNIFDCTVAAAGLIVFSPIMLAIMAAIWYESGRPFFFSQARLGRHGRLFYIHKFRKFGPQEGTSGLGVTVKGDMRLTPLGAILERTKLDELPQLWNVLKGDMAIVGPRPESTKFADCFTGPFRQVLDHKPGIFGPCQVLFRNEGALYPEGADVEQFYRDVLFKKKAKLDIEYFAHHTLWSDIQVLAQGVFGVLGIGREKPLEALPEVPRPQPAVAKTASAAQDAGSIGTPTQTATKAPSAVQSASRVRVHAGLPGAGKRERAVRGAAARASMAKPRLVLQNGGNTNGTGSTPVIGDVLQQRLADMDAMLKSFENQLAVKDKQIKELTASQRDMQLMLRNEFKYIFPVPGERQPAHADVTPRPLKAADEAVLPHAASK